MTRLIGPASPFICTEVDVAFGANLNDPSESWDWTTLGDYQDGTRTRPRLLDQTIDIAHGRRDGANLADPTTVEVLLGNGDLALTPRNPASAHYPGLKRGTPLRVVVQAGLPHLLLTGLAGSRARTPDAAALDVPGDLSFAVELLSPVQVPPSGGTYELAGKWVATGNQRSWVLAIGAGGNLVFFWSTDGTAVLSKSTSVPLPYPEAGPYTIGGWFDVSNAGNNILTWYVKRGTVDDLRADLAGSVFGEPDVDTGTTSLFASTAPLDVGDVEAVTNFTPYPGRLNRFQMRSGDLSTGTVVADLRPTQLAPGATGTTDSAGRVWTFSAEVTNRRPRFCGRIDEVKAEWGEVDESNPLMPTIAYVRVSASGLLERLAQADSIGSALTRAVSAPVNQSAVPAAWMFEDGSDATTAAQLVPGAAPMAIRGSFSFGGDTSYPSVLQQMTIGSGDNAYMSASIPQIPQVPGVNWQVTRFFRIDEAAVDPAATQLMAVDTNGQVATWRITVNDAQVAITGSDSDGSGVVLATFATDARFFDTEAMVVLDVTDDGADVDWVVNYFPISLGGIFGTSGTFTGNTGVPHRFRNSCTGPPSGIALGPLIVSTGRDIGWLGPADTAYVGEPAPQRVARLCQEQGIPIAVDGPYGTDWDAGVLAGAQAMGPQRPKKILELFEECARADFGVVGEQRGGLGLTYRSRVTIRNQEPRLTLRRSLRQAIDPFEEVDDDLRFVNDVTVSRTDGSAYRIEDPGIAAGDEERYQQNVEVNVASDLLLPAQTGWRYHLGTWPEPRYPQVRTDVAKDESLVEDVLGFGIGDRFGLVDPPPGCPPVDQLADGIVEELERFQWRVAVNGNPARPWDTAVVDDPLFGRVGTAAAVTTTVINVGTTTSVTVASTYGPWTTTEEPFDIEVDGVRFRVTTVTGATSPQTFTVEAAPLNGDITRTIQAGATVRLWQPAVIAH
jgi:hypothetical protein